jgi:hypothetical protein
MDLNEENMARLEDERLGAALRLTPARRFKDVLRLSRLAEKLAGIRARPLNRKSIRIRSRA